MAAVHAENFERPRGAQDVHDRVDRADLVEVHLLQGDAVRFRFGLSQDLERAERPAEHAIGETPRLQHAPDFGEVAVRLRLARFHFELERLEPVPLHPRFAQGESVERERFQLTVDLRERRAERDERSQDHVAGGSGHAVEIDDAHIDVSMDASTSGRAVRGVTAACARGIAAR